MTVDRPGASPDPDEPEAAGGLADLLGGMLGDTGGLGEVLRQAQQIQGRLQEAQETAAAEEVVGTAGGGVVRVTVTGSLDFRSVEIAPEVVDPRDVGMLEDLVLAAIHDGMARARRLTQDLLGGAVPGLPGLPGLSGPGDPTA